MNKNNITLKYECLNDFENITNSCSDQNIKNLLYQLRDLIFYQMNEIKNQRMKIIAYEHKESWKRYDLPETNFKVDVDKPPKSGNMSC